MSRKANLLAIILAGLPIGCGEDSSNMRTSTAASVTGSEEVLGAEVLAIPPKRDGGTADPEGDPAPDEKIDQVYYEPHIREQVQEYCANCHSDALRAGGYSFDNYIDSKGTLTATELWSKAVSSVLGEAGIAAMPPGPTRLPAGDLAVWTRWRQDGFPWKDPVQKVSRPITDSFASGVVRLSTYQQIQTLRYVFENQHGGRNILDETSFQFLPDDEAAGNSFDSTIQILSAAFLEATRDAGEAVAASVVERLLASSGYKPRVFLQCLSTEIVKDDCIKAHLEPFLQKGYRRQPTNSEINRYFALYKQGETAEFPKLKAGENLKLLVQALVLSPYFTYNLAINGDLVEDNSKFALLSGEELANRLAYFAWGEPADEELMTLSQSGELEKSDVLQLQVDRLLDDARAKRYLDHFTRQWLNLDAVNWGPFSEQFQSAVNVAGYFYNAKNRLLGPAKREVQDLVSSLFLGSHTFTYLYEAPPLLSEADQYDSLYTYYFGRNSSPDQDPQYLTGLLNRPALRWQMDDMSNPTLIGAFVRRQLLCEDIHFPTLEEQGDDEIRSPPTDPTMNTRQRYSSITSSVSCQTCHKAIDAAGFALLDKDAAGFSRLDPTHLNIGGSFPSATALMGQEPLEAILATQDGVTKVVNWLPIDTSVEPFIDGPGEPTVTGTNGYQAAMAASRKAKECLVRQRVFRFGLGHLVTEDDRVWLSDLTDFLEQGGVVRDMLKRTMMADQFRRKRIK